MTDHSTPQRVFDGHNDTLLRLWRKGDDAGERFIEGDGGGHIDAPRARAGGLNGGFFAIFPPSDSLEQILPPPGEDDTTDFPYIGPLDSADARRTTLEMMSILVRLDRTRPDAIRICRTAAEIDTAEAHGAIAAVMHIEGSEAIGFDLAELEVLYAAGLRSIGPVWSRPNAFGVGVPFRFPGAPDIGPGLSAAGEALIRACNDLGVMVDLSHLNEAGFWDVARISDKPLVATHSNVHALCASSRNLTDKQLDAIAESRGVVGVNYAVGFLREDGKLRRDTPLTEIVRHLDHLLAKLGEDGVALGSDFDGAEIPDAIGDAAGLPNLVAAMTEAGYGADLIDKICWRNWVDLLRRTWGG